MLIKIISLIFILSLIIGCTDLSSIESPPKKINKVENYIFVEGRWKARSNITARIISRINFTSIACDLKERTCRECISYLYAPKESRISEHAMLYSDTFTYQITDWTDGIIRAKRDAPVADIEVTISLKDNFAEKSYRETKARGSESANPDIYGKWVLE